MALKVPETVQSFLNSAAQDLEIGRTLLDRKEFPRALALAGSALEKTLKAIFVKATREEAPSTHSLPYLARSAAIEIPESIMDRLVEYSRFGRKEACGEEGGDLFLKRNEEFCRKKFGEMEDLCRWLVRELKALF